MKKNITVWLFCLLSVWSFAQTPKSRSRGKSSTRPNKSSISPSVQLNELVKPTAAPALPSKPLSGTTTSVQFNEGSAGASPTTQIGVTKSVSSTEKSAQKVDRPVDGYYKKELVQNAKVTPYAAMREADVIYSKRIWREIDLREKLNNVFAAPKARLIDIILDAVNAGELTAYDPTPRKGDVNGDEFSSILTPQQVMGKLADSVLVPILDKDGNTIGSTVKPGEFNPDSVTKYRIKEDWIFDKQRSVFEPRIVGIAPMIKIKAAGLSLEDQPAFWIYYPEARPLFATKAIANRKNDVTNLSYDDLFIKRIFSSYIVKESNVEDLRIKDYSQGIDRLYESERIKKELMDYEHDLWSY
ncbi:MAG: gliding motility protein GldN [Sphingobacteriaceae bacterium]